MINMIICTHSYSQDNHNDTFHAGTFRREMYRCDYCDGIVEAKCISIQFQRYRHTNHSEPVTIVKTIHFTPERSSLPVISTVMRAHARIRIRCERVQCEHMRMRAFASHCMRTHFSCVMRAFAYVTWASSVSVMRAFACDASAFASHALAFASHALASHANARI